MLPLVRLYFAIEATNVHLFEFDFFFRVIDHLHDGRFNPFFFLFLGHRLNLKGELFSNLLYGIYSQFGAEEKLKSVYIVHFQVKHHFLYLNVAT